MSELVEDRLEIFMALCDTGRLLIPSRAFE